MASCSAPIVHTALECSTAGLSSAANQRRQGSASTSFDHVGGPTLPSAHCPCEHRRIQRGRHPGAASVKFLQSPTGVSSSIEHELDALRCCGRTQRDASSKPLESCMLGTWSPGLWGRAEWEENGMPGNQRRRGREVSCKATSGGGNLGSLEWMSKATPYEVLGVVADSSEEDIKSAFRARIKEYHPDVYQGLGDADAITQRLLRAYELLTSNVERTAFQREDLDPFEEPECVATNVFVNELGCIGRGCPYSCVERAPDVFQFAPDTGRARAVNEGAASRKAGQYNVQLAVGQCPTNCIHYLTPQQRLRLEEILKGVLEGTVDWGEVAIMDGLIARANFENGRFRSPKRKAKKSEKWVDWY